ncbi:MAG: PEP-CTERM sorting domain-containing protein [Crocosphaera sp.]|nr:PEP-CTERM sorting domain-containing protein [Crocosphaera sp.]
MQTWNSYLNLTTTILAMGVTLLNVNPAQATSWLRTLTAGNDNYSDTNNEEVNFGGEDYIRIGNFPTGTTGAEGDVPVENQEEQIGYVSWNLQNIINTINNTLEIPEGAEVRNVDASLVLHQGINDPNNPNGPNRPLPGFARVSLEGLGVIGQWDENNAINPNFPPQTINDLDPEAPTLFTGDINLGSNTYSATALNDYIENIFNTNFNGNPNDDQNLLSIALRPTASLNFPNFGFFPIDSFFSQNQENEELKPSLELSFEVWNEAYKVLEDLNVTVQSRLGNQTTWEWSQTEKSQGNNGNTIDTVITDRNWRWRNGVPVEFELQCNPDNNLLTLTLENQAPISHVTETCEGIDGVSIFAQARRPNTEMEILLTRIGELEGDRIGVTPRDFSALGVAGQPLESDRFYFTDDANPQEPNGGGLDFTNGADFIRGLVTMRWIEEDGNPQDQRGRTNDNQIQLTALTRADDPLAGFTPQSFIPQGNPSEPQSTIFEAACVNGTPDIEIWERIASSNPDLLPEYTCSSNTISPSNTTVPEPTSILSLILLGTTGLGLRLRKK